MITQTIDDSIVMSLYVHERNHALMWAQLAEDYNTIIPAQRLAARKEFLNFIISEEDTFFNINQKYNEFLRKATVQGGVIDA